MTALAWYGLIISVVAVLAAYRFGFSAGFESGRDAGLSDGRREGARDGSLRGYAVGFDRGRRRSEQSDEEETGVAALNVLSNRFAVGVIGLILAASVFIFMRRAPPEQDEPIHHLDRAFTPSPEAQLKEPSIER